jgi:thiol-disulfide isomerase/thioredoxin
MIPTFLRRRPRLARVAVGVLLGLAAGLAALAVVEAEQHPPAASSGAVVPPALAHGAHAPGFTLPRLGGGPPVSLGAFAGRPVVINFFASWCTDCREELRAFGVAWHAVGARAAFVGIDANDPAPATARQMLAAAGDGYPTGIDRFATVAQQYLVPGLPETVYLDASGRVVDVALGAQTAGQVEHWVSVAAGR